MVNESTLSKTSKRLNWLAVFTFFLSPTFSWGSVIASDETAVFASLSRMIWYSGSAGGIFAAMLILFLPMLVSFFLAHDLIGMARKQKLVCRISMLASCVILYFGAMEVMPSNGAAMTPENILHGVLSFGGMLLIFLTYCLYAALIRRKDRDGAMLLFSLLIFILITGAFAVLNVFDEKSYVVASAVSELYVLTMLGLTGYLTYYLAYRSAKADCAIQAAREDVPWISN